MLEMSNCQDDVDVLPRNDRFVSDLVELRTCLLRSIYCFVGVFFCSFSLSCNRSKIRRTWSYQNVMFTSDCFTTEHAAPTRFIICYSSKLPDKQKCIQGERKHKNSPHPNFISTLTLLILSSSRASFTISSLKPLHSSFG